MHVNAKKTAVSGLMMALSVVFIVLSGILEFNTLFFLAAAAFLIGIIIREYGLGFGTAFFIGCTVMGFMLAPQQLYCITYAMMGVYVLAIEFLWQFLGKYQGWKIQKMIFIAGKFLIFNMIYIPALLLFPKLLFAGEIADSVILVFILGGQAALVIFDRTYEYFLIQMWGQFRDKIFGKK